jgi:uncharacterized protein (DUF305 family)
MSFRLVAQSRRPPVTPVVIIISVIVTAVFTGCAAGSATGAASTPAPASSAPGDPVAARVRADSARRPYTEADIRFMTRMMHHHQQAVLIAGWAPSHGAGPAVRRLAERIVNGQRDEIGTMRQWLEDRGQPVHGGEHAMHMPGMLNDAQLRELDGARGSAFDRLFLADMIQHHRGAVSMVRDLFGTQGAAQDETVFKFANDVSADQSTEIARMEAMLATYHARTSTQ